jgi:hypothetical protein
MSMACAWHEHGASMAEAWHGHGIGMASAWYQHGISMARTRREPSAGYSYRHSRVGGRRFVGRAAGSSRRTTRQSTTSSVREEVEIAISSRTQSRPQSDETQCRYIAQVNTRINILLLPRVHPHQPTRARRGRDPLLSSPPGSARRG